MANNDLSILFNNMQSKRIACIVIVHGQLQGIKREKIVGSNGKKILQKNKKKKNDKIEKYEIVSSANQRNVQETFVI